MNEDYQKALEKVTSFFLPKPVPFNRQSFQKQNGPGTSHQSLFRIWNKFRKFSLLVSNTLSDQVWWYETVFDLVQKNTLASLCKPIYDIINYLTYICPFESAKCGREGKKLQKFDYLKNKKSFLDKIKNILHSSFSKAYHLMTK